MAKAKKKTHQGMMTFEEFVSRKPELTVLTDHPLTATEAFEFDTFNFRFKLGPAYDILRHPATKAPAAILISGGWGTGKTSAMKWLQGLLEKWNEQATGSDIKVRPIWFYPWKYDNKDDVRRGLIAEVIINATYVRDPETKKLKVDGQKLKEGVKRLGLFAASAAIDLASAVRIGVPGFGEISGKALEDVVKDFKEAAHPEKIYLQEYEAALKEWVEKSLGKNERMVIFIDDLDRCIPDIALQVLEALKLYLNMPNLMFVVGVDKQVIEKLVVEYYTKLGLVKKKDKDDSPDDERQREKDEGKARQYLSKMFQVEIEVSPNEKQIEDFFVEQLKDIAYWKELSPEEQKLFRDLVLKFAGRNPREVKRLLNSALMMGVGAVLIKKDGLKFNQGMQLFFVRKILDERYTMASEAGSKRGTEFFLQWSQIVRAGLKDDPDFPLSIKVPKDFVKREVDWGQVRASGFDEQGIEVEMRSGKVGSFDLGFIPQKHREMYRPILENSDFSPLLSLLDDEDLGRLMQIPYTAETAEVSAIVGTSKDVDIIRDAVARQLKKKTDQLTDDDYRTIEELDFFGSNISDLAPLKSFTNLQVLNLFRNPVSDARPLATLTNLKELHLYHTQVSDVGPLASLTKLQWLDLSDTKVTDLRPLDSLTNLQRLVLGGTQVSDVGPLASLANLQALDLSGTQVAYVGSLASLKNLQTLILSDTQVSDVSVLTNLANLKTLFLSRTGVRDVNVISGIKSLVALNLSGTRVNDIHPISSLTNLEVLRLNGTNVNDIGILSRLTNLKLLDLASTAVSDEQVAEVKKALPELQIHR